VTFALFDYSQGIHFFGMAMKIRTAIEVAGVEFVDENGGGPGVRLRKRTSKRSK
jgi:hypothetical protein